MPRLALPFLLMLVAVPGAAQAPPVPPPDAQGPGFGPGGAGWTQLTIREHLVIRIPRMRRPPPPEVLPGEAPLAWEERRGARCIPADGIAGALVSPRGSVDLVMDDGRRTRALLDGGCPGFSYYLGFYIRPTVDGMICAGRDSFRSRAGASCPIRAFRRLVPRR